MSRGVLADSTPSIRLSVVIPVHNEAKALAELLPELCRSLDSLAHCSWEVIVVDDGSTEKMSLIAGRDRVRFLRHSKRCGSGAARKTGSRVASGELIIWIDGDGTYPLEALVDGVRSLDQADQAIGWRTTDFGHLRLLRLLVKNSTAKVASWLWGVTIPDLNSGLRVFRRECLSLWLEDLPDGFSCTTTATLSAYNHQQRVAFFPISYLPREATSHSKFHPLWDTLRLWRTIWRCWRRRKWEA